MVSVNDIWLNIVCHSLLATCCQNTTASEEDTEVVEEGDLIDFTPFVAKFRTYKKDLSEADKFALMTDGMENLRDSVYIKGLIYGMFNYERDIALVESEIFDWPDPMDVVFKKMLSLNMSHSEKIEN